MSKKTKCQHQNISMPITYGFGTSGHTVIKCLDCEKVIKDSWASKYPHEK